MSIDLSRGWSGTIPGICMQLSFVDYIFNGMRVSDYTSA